MTKPNFDKWKVAGSLPPILVLHQDLPPLYAGGASPGFDINTVDLTDNRILMQQVLYTTHDRVHGLLHYDGPTQLFFMGYKCARCHQVFLVPDTVGDNVSLGKAMHHGCTRSTRPEFGPGSHVHPNTGRSSTGS